MGPPARHSATARDRRDASPRPRARAMPSAAYDNVVRGGLRLKTKASGVAKEAKKRHKKDKKREKKEVRRDATRPRERATDDDGSSRFILTEDARRRRRRRCG